MEIPISTPHHCNACDEVRPHHPESLICLRCESVLPASYFPYESVGRIEVSLRKRQRWAFLACDPGIVAYYHWFLAREGLNLASNFTHPHVSFVRDELPSDMDAFLAIDGRQGIRFRYSNVVRTNGFHYWLDVRCCELFEIRRSVGLADDNNLSLHVTIGRRFRVDERLRA